MVIQGTFHSIWDDGVDIATPASLDTKTGEIATIPAEVENLDILNHEYFESESGEEFTVCPECHEYILHTCMEPGIGHNLDEVKRCKNPDCDYARYV